MAVKVVLMGEHGGANYVMEPVNYDRRKQLKREKDVCSDGQWEHG